jgi:hypothetical protein
VFLAGLDVAADFSIIDTYGVVCILRGGSRPRIIEATDFLLQLNVDETRVALGAAGSAATTSAVLTAEAFI